MSDLKSDQTIKSRIVQLGKMWDTEDKARGARANHLTTPRDQPRASSPINDNQCVFKSQEGLLAGSLVTEQRQYKDTFVKLNVVNHAHTAPGLSQKKEISPGVADCHPFQKSHTVKYVKGVSCVTQLSYVQTITNVRNVVTTYPVGARFQHFWKVWLELGAGPKVTHILREGYLLPFRIRPRLTRYPTVVSCYVNPHRDSYLMEALHQLIDKNAVELVQNQKSLGFFNRLFLVCLLLHQQNQED